MEVVSSRFGPLAIDADDVIQFPAGMLGLACCRDWVLLADAHHDALGWLQSTTRPEVALAVVSPRRYVPSYQIRVPRSELAPLALADPRQAKVLVVAGRNDRGLTLNLKAPLVLNLERRLGRQVVVSSDYSVQHELNPEPQTWRKSA